MGNCCGSGRETNLILLGLDGSGKTSISKRLQRDQFSEKHSGTIGFSCDNITLRHQLVYLWDVGGLKSQRSQWNRYMKDVEGIIFVVDAANTTRYHEALDLLKDVLKSDEAFGLPVAILLNKKDKVDNMAPLVAMFEKFTAEKVKVECRIFTCSAKLNDGVEMSVSKMVRIVRKKYG